MYTACVYGSIDSGRTLRAERLVSVKHDKYIARCELLLDILSEVDNIVADCPIHWPVYYSEDS